MNKLSRSVHSILATLAIAILASGCATTLVADEAKVADDNLAHCSGSESVDDSSVAVLPIPVVAFFTPHVDLNDNTVEGLQLKNVPAFSVQYHPEAAPGPRDAHYLFERFAHLMRDWKKGDATA